MSEYNTNPIVKRIAIKANCVFETPALIGSGVSGNTDSDVLRDNNGNAFLPGSTIAGVLKSLSSDTATLFGENDAISPLWVYDANLEDATIITLDGVEIGRDNKVALESKKYDYEAVCAKFTLRLLLTIREKDKGYEGLLAKLIGVINSGIVSFGAKTRRGFGRVSCEGVYSFSFDLCKGNETELKKWIDFEWKNQDGFTKEEGEHSQSDYKKITALIRLDGSVMIRDTRNIYDDIEEGDAPDYKHLSVGGKPAILGTSWAGAFRSGLYRLLAQKYPENAKKYLDEVFGYVSEEECEPSKIIFGASFLKPVNKDTDGYLKISRVKIDRFTGGAAAGALFSETPWYGGETTLEVRYPKNRGDIRELIMLGLDAADKGFIAIGGETSVGRGFISITKVRDEDGGVSICGAKQELKAKIEKTGGESA
ncbi:hypothetical protein AGMMS49975_08160 [Clostridia bacterium]|nr:hypothetical protein AGMMS49975_08160 [Clostridia bacterium]